MTAQSTPPAWLDEWALAEARRLHQIEPAYKRKAAIQCALVAARTPNAAMLEALKLCIAVMDEVDVADDSDRIALDDDRVYPSV